MTTESAGPMTKEKMEEYFRSFNAAGSTKTLSTYYTEDAVFKTPWGKVVSGLDNIIKYMDEGAHHGDKIKESLTAKKILIDGDGVAVELETELEALDDVPDYHLGPSFKKGEIIRWRLSAFYKIRDGKIADVQVYIVLEEWLRKWLK
jgi:ketosteroid isomerase-like protein